MELQKVNLKELDLIIMYLLRYVLIKVKVKMMVHEYCFNSVRDQSKPNCKAKHQQVLHFIQVGLFIVICDQAHHSCDVSKLDDGVGVKRLDSHACTWRSAKQSAMRLEPCFPVCIQFN